VIIENYDGELTISYVTCDAVLGHNVTYLIIAWFGLCCSYHYKVRMHIVCRL